MTQMNLTKISIIAFKPLRRKWRGRVVMVTHIFWNCTLPDSFPGNLHLCHSPKACKTFLAPSLPESRQGHWWQLLSLSEKLHVNSGNFSMIHLNIRSGKKNFEKFKGFLFKTGSFFQVLCLTETWFDDRNSESWLYHGILNPRRI